MRASDAGPSQPRHLDVKVSRAGVALRIGGPAPAELSSTTRAWPVPTSSISSATIGISETWPGPRRWPMLLAEAHRVLQVGSPLVIEGSVPWSELTDGMDLGYLIEGGGFTESRPPCAPDRAHWRVQACRAHSLADTVGPAMRVMIAGLNPSEHAATAGYGFAGPGNRFWPAATAAGLVSEPGNPRHALDHHGVGMTDLVKRATPRAAALARSEYACGLTRLDALCRWLEPQLVCIVGITGWRAATGDRGAVIGPQPISLGDRPVYVMPNPSGLNAHTNHEDLMAHFVRVERIAAGSA